MRIVRELHKCKLCGADIIGRAPNATMCSECKRTRKKKYYISKPKKEKIRTVDSKQRETCEFGISKSSSLHIAGVRCNFQAVMGISKIAFFPDYQSPPNCSAYKKRIGKGKRGCTYAK